MKSIRVVVEKSQESSETTTTFNMIEVDELAEIVLELEKAVEYIINKIILTIVYERLKGIGIVGYKKPKENQTSGIYIGKVVLRKEKESKTSSNTRRQPEDIKIQEPKESERKNLERVKNIIKKHSGNPPGEVLDYASFSISPQPHLEEQFYVELVRHRESLQFPNITGEIILYYNKHPVHDSHVLLRRIMLNIGRTVSKTYTTELYNSELETDKNLPIREAIMRNLERKFPEMLEFFTKGIESSAPS